jgi:hypothetical protein
VPNTKEPFLHPAIAQTLKKAYFSSQTGLGFAYKDKFPLGSPSQTERELPKSLVALAATGVCTVNYTSQQHSQFNFYRCITASTSFRMVNTKRLNSPATHSSISMTPIFEHWPGLKNENQHVFMS